jgi:outer membrane PBP1 activator LpoA protein
VSRGIDRIIALYKQDSSAQSEFKIVMAYVEKGEITRAKEILERIPDQYALTDSDKKDYQVLKSYLKSLGRKKSGNRSKIPFFNP